MAHIRANTKNGKIVSYRFTVCLGRDCNGKQIRKYTTWPIPPDSSTAKAKKAAERAADIWEQELMNEYHKKLEAESAGKAYQIPAEKRHDDFVSFVNDVWFPLQVRDGKHKPKTIAFYESTIAMSTASRTRAEAIPTTTNASRRLPRAMV